MARHRARYVLPAASSALFFFASAASAQEVTVVNDQPPAAQPAPGQQQQVAPKPAPYQRTTEGTPGDYDDEGEGDPPQRTGFQLALRTGVSAPAGSLADGAKQSDAFAWQVPLVVDIGGKVHPNVFVGGYLGLAFGACGSAFDNIGSVGGSCAAVRFLIGPEILVSFIPKGKVNPWAGYGIGIESSAISESVAGTSASGSYFGYDIAHLSGGVDFRLTKVFGVGPFLDFGIGRYTHASTDGGTGTTTSGSIDRQAWHEWITIGPRFVFFP